MEEKKTETYEQSIRRRPILRVMAWVGLVVIFALIVLVIVTGVTGSKYFMPSLALMIIVPILIMWCFGWERFCKITKRIGLEK